MASQLLNRLYAVTWNDFHAPPPADAKRDAHIETEIDLKYGWVNGAGGTRLADSVTVTIKLLRHKSWAKKQRIRSFTPTAQADLLRHEQGHYDITALMGRDLFIDLMAMKGRSFADVAALQTAVRDVAKRYAPQPIHTKYDSRAETLHGAQSVPQGAWNGYIRTATSQLRSPAAAAPDGTAYKVRLLEVLKKAGKA